MTFITTWKKLLEQTLKERGETLLDLEDNTLTDAEMTTEFDDGFGAANGVPFTAWTARTVYFPCVYDGAEWVGSISRHPDGKPTEHQGGGG